MSVPAEPQHRLQIDPAVTQLEVLDCRACAACCRDASDGRVLVSADDLVRLRRSCRHEVVAGLVPGHFGELAFPARTDGRCAHLGTAANPNDCDIYEDRATSCRSVEAGGAQCLAYRRALGLSA